MSSNHDISELEKICLVITYYEQSDTILKTIDSAINQKYRFGEIIIVDDGSTKHPFKASEAFKRYHNHFKTLTLKQNRGVVNAMNESVKMSSKDYILILNGDDILSEFFSDLIHLKRIKLNNSTLYYGDAIKIGEKSWYGADDHSLEIITKHSDTSFYWNFEEYPGTPIMSTILSKKIFSSVGGFIENPGRPEDSQFFGEAKRLGFKFQYLDFPVIYYKIEHLDQRNFVKNWESIIYHQAIQLANLQKLYSKLQKDSEKYLDSYSYRIRQVLKKFWYNTLT